jgi:hypothetical protein
LPLQDIINNPEKRKKLVVYINPPYAEATSYGVKSKEGVSSQNKTYSKYKALIGNAINELFAQFFIRIYNEIPNSNIASFSTLKYINAQSFVKFRKIFNAEFKKGFLCKSDTFDNVKGQFPIGFIIWNLAINKKIVDIEVDVFETEDLSFGVKKFFSTEKGKFIIDWLRIYFDKKNDRIAYLRIQGTDIQQSNTIFVTSQPSESDFRESKVTEVTKNNLIQASIYFAVRKVIDATWLNDRDQFLYPNDGWKTDTEFQNDCLTYTLFQNNIQSKYGTNHWIPFTEYEVGSHEKFDSHFMTNFIAGKIEKNVVSEPTLFEKSVSSRTTSLEFSPEAKAVFDAGRELWRYYHAQPGCNVNASLYDIRAHFQLRDGKGKMNNSSDDETYMLLIRKLREQIKILAIKIQPKVYQYGFLKV